MKRHALALLLLAASGVSAPGVAAPVPAGSAAVDALRGFEYTPALARPDPVTLAAWRRVAADPQEDPVIRGRALTLLATSGDAASEDVVRGLMRPGEEPFLRRKAVEALAQLRGAAALGELDRLFRAAKDDARLRAACARALGTLGPVAQRVRARLRLRESDAEIRSLLAADPRPAPPFRPRRTPK